MDSSPPFEDLENSLTEFLLYIASEKGLAKNTIEAYQRDILSFVHYLKLQDLDSFQKVEARHIVTFLAELKSANYASSSICRTLIAIKVLFKFLKRESKLAKNEAFYLETPKLWQVIPDVLTYDEIEKLLEQPDANTPFGARDKAILEVLYSSGLRVSEVCKLKIYDVDDEYVRVSGKGSKERIVPIGLKALQAVDHYLIHYRCLAESEREQSLFVSKSGRTLDRITVWQMIKKNAKAAGIVKNISPHTLRHSFATHLLDHGADLRIIQEMLGHANINSTDRYTHISRAHLQESFQACHPRS